LPQTAKQNTKSPEGGGADEVQGEEWRARPMSGRWGEGPKHGRSGGHGEASGDGNHQSGAGGTRIGQILLAMTWGSPWPPWALHGRKSIHKRLST